MYGYLEDSEKAAAEADAEGREVEDWANNDLGTAVGWWSENADDIPSSARVSVRARTTDAVWSRLAAAESEHEAKAARSFRSRLLEGGSDAEDDGDSGSDAEEDGDGGSHDAPRAAASAISAKEKPVAKRFSSVAPKKNRDSAQERRRRRAMDLQAALTRAVDGDALPQLLSDILGQCETLDVDVPTLQSTEIARCVGRLRKHVDSEVARRASAITVKWKAIASAGAARVRS